MKKNNPDNPVRNFPAAAQIADPYSQRQQPLTEILKHHEHSQLRYRKAFFTIGFILILMITAIAIFLLSN